MTLHKAENVNVQNKVVLTQAQFEAVKGYLGSYDKANLVMNVATQEFSANNPLYQIPFESLLVAIYRPEDITIEQTVEEKILQVYETYSKKGKEEKPDIYDEGAMNAMKLMLKVIGMKVKGINA